MESGGAIRGLLAASPNLRSLELRRFFRFGPSPVNLPAGLTSLVLTDTHVTSADIATMARSTPRLRRLCTFLTSEHPNNHDRPRDVMVAVLGALSQLPAAQTLEVLCFWGSRFDETQLPVLAGLPALKVLAITYERPPQPHQGFLSSILKNCRHLQGLVVHGAGMLWRAELLHFAKAVSTPEFPSFRKLKLIPRDALSDREWERLQDVAKPPLVGLLHKGGVEFALERDDGKDVAKPLVEMERAVFSS